MIKEYILNNSCTMLCTGPMSKNCIDATVELSKKFNIPQILIASRRQVDSQDFNGGYVEHFTTQEFVNYIKMQKAPNIFIARDHGGPCQSTLEIKNNLNVPESIASAIKSLKSDILAGFDFLHLDPSIPIQGEILCIDTILNRLFELYGSTYEFAQQNKKDIQFELGTEEQNGYGQNLEKFEYFLSKVDIFCKKNKIKRPTFVVAQTGTKVMETKNIGTSKNNLFEQIKNTIKICDKYGVMLKEHNTDYLSNEDIALRPIMGIHASNVAPEFGVVETRGLLYLLNMFGYKKEINLFIDTAIKSNTWEKWLLPNSSTTEIDKAIICGHYIFANKEIKIMKEKVGKELLNKYNINLDRYLKVLIMQSMTKYIQLFNMLGNQHVY